MVEDTIKKEVQEKPEKKTGIFGSIKEFFGFEAKKEEEKKGAAAAAAAAADILNWLISLVPDKAAISNIVPKTFKILYLPPAEALGEFFALYMQLERHLIEEVTPRKYTREQLRKEAEDKFASDPTAKPYLNVLKEPKLQMIKIQEMFAQGVAKELLGPLKPADIQKAVDAVSRDTLLKGVIVEENRISFEQAEATFLKLPPEWMKLVISTLDAMVKELLRLLKDAKGDAEVKRVWDELFVSAGKIYGSDAAAAAAAADISTYLMEISRGLGQEKKAEKAIISVTPQAREMISSIGLGELVTRGLIKNIETELVPKSGEAKPVSVTASALKDEAGNIQGMVIAAKDLTEVQKLQKENLEILEKAKEEAEALVAKRTKELEDTVGRLTASEQQQKAANQQLNAANQQLGAAQKNLQDKLLELERFNKVAVGRELKMVELKEEIARLKGAGTESTKALKHENT